DVERIDREADEPRDQDAEAVGYHDERQTGEDSGPVGAYIREDTTQFRHDRPGGHRTWRMSGKSAGNSAVPRKIWIVQHGMCVALTGVAERQPDKQRRTPGRAVQADDVWRQ